MGLSLLGRGQASRRGGPADSKVLYGASGNMGASLAKGLWSGTGPPGACQAALRARRFGPGSRGDGDGLAYMVCWSSDLTSMMSAEIKVTGSLPLFFHQWDRPTDSMAASPARCSIGTAQLLLYSVIVPSTI